MLTEMLIEWWIDVHLHLTWMGPTSGCLRSAGVGGLLVAATYKFQW